MRTFVGLTLLTTGFLGTLATILGFFGSTAWFFDALANFRFQLALGLIAVGVVYFFGFGRWTAFIFIALGAVNAFMVAPLYLDNPAPAASETTLTIVSYNVGAGSADQQEVIDYVGERSPDLVFFLESTEEWVNAMPTAGTGYAVGNQIPEDRAYGITVLGDGVTVVELLELGTTDDPVMRVQATIDDQQVAVFAVHPRPPDSEGTTEARDTLFAELADLISQEPMPVVVIGDFNATPWSYVFRDFSSDTGLVNSQNGFGLSATWPSTLPVALIPLDHMLHSDSLTTVTREVGPDLGSDHLPLLVEVSRSAG